MIPQLRDRDPIGRPAGAITICSIAGNAITQKRGSLWPSRARSHHPSFDIWEASETSQTLRSTTMEAEGLASAAPAPCATPRSRVRTCAAAPP